MQRNPLRRLAKLHTRLDGIYQLDGCAIRDEQSFVVRRQALVKH
jgi:hypothetical protein